jgi:hypothetical protein
MKNALFASVLHLCLFVRSQQASPCLDVSWMTVNKVYAANQSHDRQPYNDGIYNYLVCSPNARVVDSMIMQNSSLVIYTQVAFVDSASLLIKGHPKFWSGNCAIYAKSTATIHIIKPSDTISIFAEPGVVINDFSGKTVVTVTNCIKLPSCLLASTAKVNTPSVQLFPNPARDELHIRNDARAFEFAVYNSLGEKLIEDVSTENKKTVDLRTLPPGVYFLAVSGKYFRFVKAGSD